MQRLNAPGFQYVCKLGDEQDGAVSGRQLFIFCEIAIQDTEDKKHLQTNAQNGF